MNNNEFCYIKKQKINKQTKKHIKTLSLNVGLLGPTRLDIDGVYIQSIPN